MNGKVDPARVKMEEGEEEESVSNPVDFLVPEVMGSTVLEKA